MKNKIKNIIFAVTSLALSLTMAGCGTNVPPTPDGGGEGEASNWQENMHREENDFLLDDNRRPSRLPFEDNTPLEEEGATLVPYRFEAESAKIKGNTNGEDHFCTGKSIEFSPSFSGNVTLCNLGTATLNFTFTSDKAVRSTLLVRLSNQYASSTGSALAGYANMTVNDKPVVDLSATFDVESGEAASGSSSQYFTMVTVETLISIAEGTNVLSITPASSNYLNLDYIEIQTSAELEDKTQPTITDPSSFVNVQTKPTESATGKIAFACHNKKVDGVEVDCERSNGRARNLPALTDEIYTKKDLSNGVEYTAKLFGEDVVIASSVTYTLTLDGATFENGDATAKVAPGETPVLKYTVPEGKMFSHWEDANGNNLGETFVMPENDITIKPVFINANNVTVTLQGATLNGESVINVAGGDEIDLSTAVIANMPEGKTVIGWYNVDSKEVIEGNTFAMPNNSVTLAPLFDAETYFNSKNDVNVGKMTKTGNLYSSRVSGCYNLQNNQITGAVRDENGNYEVGGIYHFKGGTSAAPTDMAVGSWFLTQEMNGLCSKLNDVSKTVTTTVQNFGSEDVTLRFALITSSANPDSQYGEATVTIRAGESVTFTFDVTYVHDSIMTNIMVKENAVSEVYIGMYQYIADKA